MSLDIAEFEELMDEVQIRFIRANGTGELEYLLEKLGWEDLITRKPQPLGTYPEGKILVIGEATVETKYLIKTAKNLGIHESRFDFELDYHGAKTFNYDKLAYNTKYRVVLMGATPHSTTGTGDRSSVLTELQNHPDVYPRVVPLRVESGELKTTKTSFRKALEMLLEERYIA